MNKQLFDRQQFRNRMQVVRFYSGATVQYVTGSHNSTLEAIIIIILYIILLDYTLFYYIGVIIILAHVAQSRRCWLSHVSLSEVPGSSPA